MDSSKQDYSILANQSWFSAEHVFNKDLLSDLFNELKQHEKSSLLSAAKTRRMDSKTLSDLRGDSTLWLDDPRCGGASKKFLDALDILRKDLNQSLLLGLESVEAHYAVYPPGAAYARHRDRFRDDDARVLSLVCYLNADWPRNAGGELRLHLADGHHDIPPNMGTSVIFLSEEIEHEVLPATQTRYSIAAWFRQREIKLR
jgi:SM-20-related protein